MALCVRLVGRYAGYLAALHRAGAKRKSGPRRSTRMGTNVHVLLELLARADIRHGGGAPGVGDFVAKTMAGG